VTLRSFLFIPGDNEKKLAKGDASGADALVLDLEDSVAPARKPIALEMVLDYLSRRASTRVSELWIRINPVDEGGLDDLVSVVRAAPDGVMIPKTNHPADLVRLSHFVDALERRDQVDRTVRFLPVSTETPTAAFGLAAYPSTPLARLFGLTWGAEDLSTALGASTNREPQGGWAFTYRMVRSNCLLAAKATQVAAIETLYADYRDIVGLKADCEEARREGFTGRIAIHPNQVPVINEAFTPSAQEIEHARRVIAAFAAVPGLGVVGLDGKMLDIPHLRQAEQVLARSETLQNRGRYGG
jgi:citrate lyase subunit beta/citryl-CoA lyase